MQGLEGEGEGEGQPQPFLPPSSAQSSQEPGQHPLPGEVARGGNETVGPRAHSTCRKHGPCVPKKIPLPFLSDRGRNNMEEALFQLLYNSYYLPLLQLSEQKKERPRSLLSNCPTLHESDKGHCEPLFLTERWKL